MEIFKKVIIELYFTLCGKDKRLSLRRILAVLFSGALIHLSILHVTKCNTIQEGFIWAFVALITALLGLTTYGNIAERKIEQQVEKEDIKNKEIADE